jgi:uncharacterized repeat protein (TIGR02543 family)
MRFVAKALAALAFGLAISAGTARAHEVTATWDHAQGRVTLELADHTPLFCDSHLTDSRSCMVKFVPPGTKVIFTAAPAAGYVFDGWFGKCSGRSLSYALTAENTMQACLATFKKLR